MGTGPCAVIVPVFGRHELTHALVQDIARESHLVTVIVVDNGGDYQPVGSEQVLRQDENLGWLRGCNVGIRAALAAGSQALVLLNNDTRLSPGFFAGLLDAADGAKVGMVGPRYDDHWPHQHVDVPGGPPAFLPLAREWSAPFIDGTCMLLKREVLERIGLLDEDAFGASGWGADIDLAIRTRRQGWKVVVTDRAFLSHAAGSTAGTRWAPEDYWRLGNQDMRRGLEAKWGRHWEWVSGVSGRGPRAILRRVTGAARRREPSNGS